MGQELLDGAVLLPEHDTDWGPCVDSPSPELVQDLWGTYVGLIRDGGAPIDDHLAGGLHEQEVRRQLAEIQMEPNPELVAWYHCHNGWISKPETRPVHVFPESQPLSLENAIRVYRDEPMGRGFGELEWNPNWLRILDPVHGVAVRSISGDVSPPLVRYVEAGILYEGNDDPQVVSLCTLLARRIEALQEGAYRWQGNRWVRDQERMAAWLSTGRSVL